MKTYWDMRAEKKPLIEDQWFHFKKQVLYYFFSNSIVKTTGIMAGVQMIKG